MLKKCLKVSITTLFCIVQKLGKEELNIKLGYKNQICLGQYGFEAYNTLIFKRDFI